MVDDKTFYFKQISNHGTFKSLCNTVRNDKVEEVQELLARLGEHIPNHPRYETLKQLFVNRINDIQK
jgi:hypothetical protein